MIEYKARLGENGRIVIPAACRNALDLEPGDELLIRIENNELHLLSLKQSVKKAQAMAKQYTKGRSLVADLKKMRNEEKNDE